MITTSEYEKALKSINIPDSYMAMLKAHYSAPNRTITVTELAKAAGYPTFGTANLHYGTLGKNIGSEICFKPTVFRKDKTPIWTFVLAEGVIGKESKQWEWTMRPELAEALENLGLVK